MNYTLFELCWWNYGCGVLIPSTSYTRCCLSKVTSGILEVGLQFCTGDVRRIQFSSWYPIKLCPVTLMISLCPFKMSLSPKLLMEVAAIRSGIGGKFPWYFWDWYWWEAFRWNILPRSQEGLSSLTVPVLASRWDQGGSQWLWQADLISWSHNWPKCVPGKALLVPLLSANV